MATPTNLPAAFVSGAILTADQMNNLRGAFRVLQVVTGTTSVQATSSSISYADTGLTATITPQSSTSKILVLVTQVSCYRSAGSTDNAINLRLMRGATEIQKIANNQGYSGTAIIQQFTISGTYLDSPATTSATTYKTQFANLVAAAEVGVQIGNVGPSTITLLEISA